MPGSSIVSQPLTTINIVPAALAVSNTAQRVLVVGQMLATGTAVSGQLVEQIPNDNSESALFGAKSQIASAIRAFKQINRATRIDAVPLADNGSAVQATATITVTGTATAAGSIEVAVGSVRNSSLAVAVTAGDSASTVATAIAAAINANADALVTATASTSTVTITATNGGSIGNNYGVRVVGTAPGIAVSTTAMSGGQADPTLTGLFDAIGENRYQTIIWPYEYGLTAVKDLLDARFNADNNVLDGVAITSAHDTFANLRTAGAAENSQSAVILGFNAVDTTTNRGSSLLEPHLDIAANLAAVRSLRLTDGASIARYVNSSNGPRDSFGGPALASLPYFNTPFPFLPLIPTGLGFDPTELEDLKTAGVSTLGVDRASTGVIADEIVTTYKTDSAGNPDASFKFLNYVDTSSAVREYMWNNVKARFAQSRLTLGDVLQDRTMANEQVIRAYMVGLYDTLSGADFVLTQAGETARRFFVDNMRIQIDLVAGRATINMQVPLVTQLREFIGTMQIAFGTEG